MTYPFKVETPVEPKGQGHDYEYTAEALKEERDSAWAFIKRLGATFVEGKDLVSVSMPVTMCEPASFLERMTRGWVTMPEYCRLIDAAETDIEKMKHTVAMVVSGLHINTACKKPFNPVLGETYESTFADGTQVFAEQTSHHPPVACWEVLSSEAGKWKFTGTAKWSGYFAGNAVKGGEHGVKYLEFASGYKVQWTLPSISVGGVLTGNRILDHVGCVEFKDNSEPPLVCRVGFGDQRHLMEWMSDGGKWLAGALTGGWWSSQDEQVRHKDDELSGEIFIASSNEASGSDSRMVLSRVSGSWLKGVEFTDGTDAAHCYWAREQTPTTAIDNTLPSSALPTDSRVRADITGLAAGTLDTAQEAKERIENEQRHLAKLRKGE